MKLIWCEKEIWSVEHFFDEFLGFFVLNVAQSILIQIIRCKNTIKDFSKFLFEVQILHPDITKPSLKNP